MTTTARTIRSVPKVIACLGDSLTYGATINGIHHPWPEFAAVDPRLFPAITTANHGKNGDVVAGFQTRYDQAIQGHGYDGLHILGAVNDVQLETPAATIWAALESLIDEARVRMPVFLNVTSPAGGFATWNPNKQTILLQLRDLMLNKKGVQILDSYTLMADPLRPDFLDPLKAYLDGLHYNEVGALAMSQYVAGKIAGYFGLRSTLPA